MRVLCVCLCVCVCVCVCVCARVRACVRACLLFRGNPFPYTAEVHRAAAVFNSDRAGWIDLLFKYPLLNELSLYIPEKKVSFQTIVFISYLCFLLRALVFISFSSHRTTGNYETVLNCMRSFVCQFSLACVSRLSVRCCCCCRLHPVGPACLSLTTIGDRQLARTADVLTGLAHGHQREQRGEAVTSRRDMEILDV